MKTEHVKCRAYKHAMDNEVPSNVLREVLAVRLIRGFYDVTRCMRCGVIRVTEMGFDGVALGAPSYYDYDEGYENVTHMSSGEAKVWLYKDRRKRAAKERVDFAGRGPSPRVRRPRVAAAG